MSQWDGCPIIACKNELCYLECQHKKRQKELAIAEQFLREQEAARRFRDDANPYQRS